MTNYTDWDRRIIGAIADDGPSCATIYVRLGVNPAAKGDKPTWRLVDRRLQAMRRQGRVVYDGRGWRRVKP